MYVLGSVDKLRHGKLGEALCHSEGSQAHSRSESSLGEVTHLQSIWFNSGWQRQSEARGGRREVGWHCMRKGVERGGGEVADRQKDKGRLNEGESSWKMADSFLVQERSSHRSGGDTVAFSAPPWADTSRHRKVILLFPLSQLTDCQSQISSLTLSVPVGPSPFLTVIDPDRDKPLSPWVNQYGTTIYITDALHELINLAAAFRPLTVCSLPLPPMLRRQFFFFFVALWLC